MPLGGDAVRHALLLVALTLLASCTGLAPAPSTAPPAPAPALPPEDVVDLTIYLRRGEGNNAALAPVTRRVPITDDLPRAALELLLQGRIAGDDPTLLAPLPAGVQIRNLKVGSGTAEIDLSAALLTRGREVMREPADELLALAAIANTMTEFPSIDEVRLRVAGRSSGVVEGHEVSDFWGFWGLPDVLVRDESVIVADASGTREPLLDFDELRSDPQDVGVAGAGPVTVPAVRVQDHICSLRLVVDLAEPGTAAVAASSPVVPASRVIPVGDDLLLQIDGVVLDGAVPGNLSSALESTDIEQIAVDTTTSGTLKIRIQRAGERLEPPRVWLHALDGPTRIVLDIQK